METIKWKNGARFKLDAADAYSELQAIRAAAGGDLTASHVVDAAAQPSSPLHPEFEWDDARAAHQHRLETARNMVRSIEVVREDQPEQRQRVFETVTVRHSTDGHPRRVYRTVHEILADPDTKAELLARAKREMQSFRQRYETLTELAGVFAAVDELLLEPAAV